MKRFSSLKWGITLLPLLTFFHSFGQESSILIENESVIVSANYSECGKITQGTNNNYLLLTIENKTTEKITVTFDKEVYFDGICSSCKNENEKKVQFILEPNQKIAGNCESTKDLKVFHSMKSTNSTQKLTDLKIKNLSVIKN